jgi:exopolyphosphatase / guanosine-5'-triphosphate,3'-diphosphate pyrophosphatase
VADAADVEAVTRLLGRHPAGDFAVVVRRPDGSPVVIQNAPFLQDGRPMPTRYWLVDAALRDEVSTLEAAGGVRQAQAAVDAGALADAHARYAAERDRQIPEGRAGPRPTGGVGGTRRGVKCLHAHLAWFLAGGDDPVGRWTAARLGLEAGTFVTERHHESGTMSTAALGPVAALDCGTNSTRLLITDADGRALERQMRITRLGEGVDATGRLDSAAVARTLAVLKDYRALMDRHGVVAARLVATSAVRDAGDSSAFLHGVLLVTGVEPEVLSGLDEGRLSFAGAVAGLRSPMPDAPNAPDAPDLAGPDLAGPDLAGPVLVVDIGGGSTELALGAVDDPPSDVAAVSVDVGCVRLSERFLHSDPPAHDELAAARAEVQARIRDARAALGTPGAHGLMVGLAGTVSTLASLAQGLEGYERDRIHHFLLTRAEVASWLARLSGADHARRLDLAGMVRGREDVIVGGVIVLDVVMEEFARTSCLVSEDDILDGLAATLRQVA